MIRVLLVSHSLTTGGAERFTANLAAALDRRRFAPEVVLATGRSDYLLPADVALSSLGYAGVATLPRTVWRLRRRIAAARPDLMLSNVLSTNCLTGTALAGLHRPPAWVARAGLAPGADPLGQRLWARRVYRRAAVVVANSAAMAPALAAAYPAVRGRVRVLPNPTDFAALAARAGEPAPAAAADHPGAHRPLLLAVGRLSRQKRPDLVLAALARVRQEVDARLVWCGDGPLAAAAAAEARTLGVADAVRWLGFCANPFPLMRQADLLVSASDAEGLPNALIEAQGLGLPVVATDCPYGPAEVVADGVTGRLVPMGDAGALAAAVLGLLADEGGRRAMGEAAAERARRLYDAAAVVPRWEALLAEVAAAQEGAG